MTESLGLNTSAEKKHCLLSRAVFPKGWTIKYKPDKRHATYIDPNGKPRIITYLIDTSAEKNSSTKFLSDEETETLYNERREKHQQKKEEFTKILDSI